MPRLQLNYGNSSTLDSTGFTSADTTLNGTYHNDNAAPPPSMPPPVTALPSTVTPSYPSAVNTALASVDNNNITIHNKNVITGATAIGGIGSGLSFRGGSSLGLNYGGVGASSASSGSGRTASALNFPFSGNGAAKPFASQPSSMNNSFTNHLNSTASGDYRSDALASDDDAVPTRWGVSMDHLPPTSAPPRSAFVVLSHSDDDDDGHVNLPSMPRPTQQFRSSASRSRDNADDDGLVDDGGAPMPPFPNPDEPVVPPVHQDQLEPKDVAIDWAEYPSSLFVSALLLDRGATLPTHKTLYEYHMAQSFLECLDVLKEGSYFIYYQSKTASPKERFFRVEMGDDGNGRQIPFLNWYIHKNAVALTDRVPLTNLVGVTPTNRSSVFRVHMVNAQTIVGCFSGDSRVRLPASGCFTLWFWDPYFAIPRSVDLLATNPMVHRLWVMTMRGILSVNSVSIGPKKSSLAAQLLGAQQILDSELAQYEIDAMNKQRRMRGESPIRR